MCLSVGTLVNTLVERLIHVNVVDELCWPSPLSAAVAFGQVLTICLTHNMTPAPTRSVPQPGLFLIWCNVRMPTSGLPSKMTKSILSLLYCKNLYQLSVAYRIVCSPQLVSEPLWHLAPHSSHSPRHHPPNPCSHLQWLTPLSTIPVAFTSHFFFSRSSQPEAILFCWDYFATIGHIFLLSRMRVVILLAISGSKPGCC